MLHALSGRRIAVLASLRSAGDGQGYQLHRWVKCSPIPPRASGRILSTSSGSGQAERPKETPGRTPDRNKCTLQVLELRQLSAVRGRATT
jgi:hypothetical protein